MSYASFCNVLNLIESVDSISRDEPDFPLMQYITNAGISRGGYTITHFKHDHRVLRLISNQINCVEWVECMGVASGCGEQEVGVASGSGWNLWVWLLGVVVRRYIDFLILLIPTLVSVLFCSSIPTFFVHFFRSCIQ